MAKYGSPSAKLLLVGGYDLIGDTTELTDIVKEGLLEESHSLGDSWREQTATGIRTAAFGQNGFFNDAVGAIHDAMFAAAAQTTARVGVIGIEGNDYGKRFMGFEGTFSGQFNRVAQRGALLKANVQYSVSGKLDEGIILQILEQKTTTDWDTDANSQDNGASSAAGGAGYLEVTEQAAGVTGFVGKIRHSADDLTYADLITFANVTAEPAAERKEVAGTVQRHLLFSGDITGTGTITVFAGFARY